MCEYAKQYYGVPADIGRRVVVNGKKGIIAEDRGNYIGVLFDSDKPGTIKNCHPTWEVEYGEMGKIRQMTRAQKRYQLYKCAGDCFGSFREFLNYAGTEECKREYGV